MERIELNDFLKYQYISNLQLSKDEKTLAFVLSQAKKDESGYNRNIYSFDGKLHQLTQSDKTGNYLFWDDQTILFQADNEGSNLIFKWLDLESGIIKEAFQLPLFTASIKKIDENRILIFSTINKNHPDLYKDEKREEKLKALEIEKDYEVLDENPHWMNGAGFTNGSRTALFMMNIDDEKSLKRITAPLMDCQSGDFLDGKFYFIGKEIETLGSWSGSLYCLDLESGKIELLVDENEVKLHSVAAFQGKLLISGVEDGIWNSHQNDYLYTYDLQSKKLEIFYHNQEGFGSSVGSDCRFGGCKEEMVEGEDYYYISTRMNSSQLFKISEAETEIHVFGDDYGSLDGLAVGKDKIYFIGMLNNKLQEIYSIDKDGSNLKQLTFFNESVLENKYIAEYEEIVVDYHDDFEVAGRKIHDDMPIYGWVLKPKDYDPTKKYPAILDVHGGPKTVYGKVFYHEMQYWANKGYFVLFCNPIGGDGRGNEFMYLSGQYGTYDYDSLMVWLDAALAAYPAIDVNNVCETGGSYGGFMTNWIIGHTDRFKACASQRSISNWMSFAGVSDIGYLFTKDQCGVDNIIDGYEKLWTQSPLKYANNAKTPTLFIHSDEDYRCPLEQGIQMMTALLQNGVETRMCLFHHENHELSRGGLPKHRIRRLKEITDWFDQHIDK